VEDLAAALRPERLQAGTVAAGSRGRA